MLFALHQFVAQLSVVFFTELDLPLPSHQLQGLVSI